MTKEELIKEIYQLNKSRFGVRYEEFKEWCLKDSNFLEEYKIWYNSGFKDGIKPIIVRYKYYGKSLDNFAFMKTEYYGMRRKFNKKLRIVKLKNGIIETTYDNIYDIHLDTGKEPMKIYNHIHHGKYKNLFGVKSELKILSDIKIVDRKYYLFCKKCKKKFVSNIKWKKPICERCR